MMAAQHTSRFVDDELLERGARSSQRGELSTLRPRKSDWATLGLFDGPMIGTVVALAPGDSVTIGRSGSAHFCIPDEGLLPEHARVSWRGVGYRLEPLSRDVWMEGIPVMGPANLASGARIQLGPNVRLRFDLHDHGEQELITGGYRAALRDRLTGAYTRHYLDERLPAELSFAAGRSADTALLMIDIDDFKNVNDAFGHLAGDAVLRIVAEQLRRSLRPEDALVRYGGDQFCILLRGLNMTNAALLAGRVLRSVTGLKIPIGREFVRLTLSVGMAAVDPAFAATSAAGLLARAEGALYRAKREGRNRCCRS